MKKILLSASALALAIAATAQDNGDKIDNNGYAFTFGGTSSGFADIGWVPGCDGDNAVKAITDDGSTAGEYAIATDGEQASWEHVELNLVDASGLSAVDIDLSDEAHQAIEVTFSATQDAEVLFMLTDNGLTVDNVNGWQVAADNNPAILYDYVAATDGEVTITNNTDSYTGNDADNGNLDWNVFALSDGSTDGLAVDSTQIGEIWVYYRSKGVTTNCASSTYNVAGTLTLKSIKLGTAVIGFDEYMNTEASFDAYPNPATTKVNFSEELESVEVYNVNGVLVESYNNVSSINTAGFEAGLYVIQTSEGYKRISVK